jgi:hypothetical protein
MLQSDYIGATSRSMQTCGRVHYDELLVEVGGEQAHRGRHYHLTAAKSGQQRTHVGGTDSSNYRSAVNAERHG